MKKRVFIISLVSFFIDLISKYIINSYLKIDESIGIIKNFFSITNVHNSGAAFSMLEGRIYLLIIVSLVALVLLIKYMSSFKDNYLTRVAFGLISGGILGNLYDRVILGYVRDFLKFNIFGYSFPVFNIADSCIVIGVILLIICMIRGDEVDGSSSK